MTRAHVSWAPAPYRAGFCITDDTDAATVRSVRAVYDHLLSLGLVATKTVWPFAPSEPCGLPPTPDSTLRGVTLEDDEYLACCRTLHAHGCELALHGASAGNDRREALQEAFAVMDAEFGGSPTYICHSRSIENPYWEAATGPSAAARWLLGRYSRHQSLGHVERSPYFWGDLCATKVRQIRLFRTRKTNTLAANPSLPYYRQETPYVRSWFSATKRGLADCTTTAALDLLEAQGGLTILYQYLHRYADLEHGGVTERFRASTERLAARRTIWTGTADAIISRRRQIQALFVVSRGPEAWLVNTATAPIAGLQVDLPLGTACQVRPGVEQRGTVLTVERIEARETRALTFDRDVAWSGRQTARLDRHGRADIDFGHGRVTVHAGRAPPTFTMHWAPGLDDVQPYGWASSAEQHRLLLGQAGIIVRELLFKGRSLDPSKYLGADVILLEDHDNW